MAIAYSLSGKIEIPRGITRLNDSKAIPLEENLTG